MTELVWLRDDLRTVDHEALLAACAASDGDGVVAVWIRESVEASESGSWLGGRPLGGAARWWYHRSLQELEPRLSALGIPLVFACGDPREILPALARELEATAVRWSRRYAPAARALDAQLKTALAEAGLEVRSYPGALLVEPWTITTSAGGYFTVFTPFHRAAEQREISPPLPAPEPVPLPQQVETRIRQAERRGVLVGLDDLRLLEGFDWWSGTVERHWSPGESTAQERLAAVTDWLASYRARHDVPADPDSTSRMSPHLRSGEVSPRMLFHVAQDPSLASPDADAWVRQLFWREFNWHLTYHVPELHRVPLRAQFEGFPYQPDDELAEAWRRGTTGIDLVDAGMLQLWHTGWMHNRVRMVTASLLTKNMLQPWWVGEQWFWDTLVDADEANNPVSWQWVAGCGADAAPYFRIFNPDRQRERFDADGAYLGTWLPLRPAMAEPPVVDLADSRREALAAYERTKKSNSG